MKQLICILSILLILGICFTSCRSIEYVPVETVRTEIKYVERGDSVRIVDKVNVRDSVRLRDSIVQVVNDKGEVIRTEIWHWKEKYSDVNTLYSLLKSKYDSLYSAKIDSVQAPYPVEKALTRWQSLKMELGGWAFGIIILFILIIIARIVYKLRKK